MSIIFGLSGRKKKQKMYYVVQVRTGNEEKVMKDIRANSTDPDGIDVFTPFRCEMRKYKGEYKLVTLPCFPGYVFVETNDPKKLFYDLYRIEDFTRLLGREGTSYHFVHLSQEEERIINILYGKENNRTTVLSDIEVVEGDKIRVLSGPLYNMEGLVTKVDLHKRKVWVKFTFCERDTEISMGINIVTKAK